MGLCPGMEGLSTQLNFQARSCPVKCLNCRGLWSQEPRVSLEMQSNLGDPWLSMVPKSFVQGHGDAAQAITGLLSPPAPQRCLRLNHIHLHLQADTLYFLFFIYLYF